MKSHRSRVYSFHLYDMMLVYGFHLDTNGTHIRRSCKTSGYKIHEFIQFINGRGHFLCARKAASSARLRCEQRKRELSVLGVDECALTFTRLVCVCCMHRRQAQAQ